MLTFIRNLLGLPQRSAKLATAHRRRSSLQLEQLEDRLALSTLAGSITGSISYINTLGYTSPFVVSGNTLDVYGTTGKDTFDFTAGVSSNTVTLNGSSFTVNPTQIHNINFHGRGGGDTVTLTDRLNQASATFSPHSATLSGSNYYVSVHNTMYNYAFGRSGDTASFYDSPGNDTFFSGGKSAGMYDSGFTYLNSATGFTYNTGYSVNGGTDTAQFFDTPGNDIYFAGVGYAGMFDSADTYSNYAKGFVNTHGYSSQGGTDTAYLFDSNAAGISSGGVFVGNQTDAMLRGYNYENMATGFSDVEAYSSGYDYYTLYSIDYTLHLHGSWEQD